MKHLLGAWFPRQAGSYWADGEGLDQAGPHLTFVNMEEVTYVNFSFPQVVAHSSQMIYTRMIGDKEEDDKEAEGGVVVYYSHHFFLKPVFWKKITM